MKLKDDVEMIELVFFRKDGFYMIESPVPDGKTVAEVVKDHAECNPGTLRIEDIKGNVLWKFLEAK